MHVEVTDLVRRTRRKIGLRFGCVRRPRPLDPVRSHILVDSFDRRARTLEKSSPVFRVRRKDLIFISIDERLEDTLNVSANRRRISGSLSHRSFSHKKAQEAQKKDWTSFEHGFLLQLILCFMCLFVACFKNKYASGISVDVNGIAAVTGPAILWRCANATPAPMDDCLGRLDWSRSLRRYQSHRPDATSALGTSDTSRTAVRVWRLVT